MLNVRLYRIAWLAAAVGILFGAWYLRRQTAAVPVYGALQSQSLWNQIPFASVPGPQATWSLI